MVFKDSTRQRAGRRQTKTEKGRACYLNRLQRQASFIELRRESRRLHNDLKIDLNYQTIMIDNLQKTVLQQQRRIGELEYQVQHLRRVPNRRRQAIRLMIDELNSLSDRIQKSVKKDVEEEKEHNLVELYSKGMSLLVG